MSRVSNSFTVQITNASSLLAQHAAQMSPGTWKTDFPPPTYTVHPFDPDTTGGNDSTLTYAARFVWDPSHQRASFVGVPHTGTPPAPGAAIFAIWDLPSNTWVVEKYTKESGDPFNHAYHHLAVTPNGDLFIREYWGSPNMRIWKHAYGATGKAAWNDAAAPDFPNYSNQITGGLEWFPEINGGAGGLVHTDISGAQWTNASISAVAGSVSWAGGDIGNYSNWIARANGYIYAGGGAGSTATVRLNPNGTTTRLGNTPVSAGDNSYGGLVLPHPNGTDLLLFVLSSSGAIYRLNGSGTTWSSSIGSCSLPPDVNFTVGVTLHTHGVIAFITHNESSSAPIFRLYKPPV